jgi:hypothetical protein
MRIAIEKPLYAKFGWIFGFMKPGFYDKPFSVLSYTAMRLSCKFLLAAGKGFGGFLCFFGGCVFRWTGRDKRRPYGCFLWGRFFPLRGMKMFKSFLSCEQESARNETADRHARS